MFKFIKLSTFTSALIIVLVVILNTFFNGLDKRNMDDTDKFKEMPYGINLCNFGSSHGLYGFSYDLVNKDKYIPFNFGLSSQVISYDYRLLQEYESHFAKGAYIIIPVSFFSLIGDLEENNDGFYEKNKRYYKILSSKLIKEYNYYTDFFVTIFPSLIRYEHLASDLLKWIIGKNLYNDNLGGWRYGMDPNFDLNKDAKAAASRHIYEHKLSDDGTIIINKYEIEELENMISFCKKNELIPMLITTPFLSEYLKEIDNISSDYRYNFRKQMLSLSKELDVPYYDYSNDNRYINNYKYFMNADHLSELGAKEFVKIIIEEVIEQ